jgi:hypothetical protein
MSFNARELALFNLAIDSKLRVCNLTRLQVQDVFVGGHVVARATFMQQNTMRRTEASVCVPYALSSSPIDATPR